MKKIMLILLDGLTLKAGLECMPCLNALRQNGKADFGIIRTLPPSLSKPVYATLLSGLAPEAHGILGNEDFGGALRTIFHACHETGIIAAAAAYHWIFELANGIAFDLAAHRHCAAENLPLGRGIFYQNDAYPDAELMADGEYLRQKYNPDFLLVHCMGADYAGHAHGGESREYQAAASLQDVLLSRYLPVWSGAGYAIIITSDHGMGADGAHAAASPDCRDTPLWLIGGPPFQPRGHCDIAPLIAAALGLRFK